MESGKFKTPKVKRSLNNAFDVEGTDGKRRDLYDTPRQDRMLLKTDLISTVKKKSIMKRDVRTKDHCLKNNGLISDRHFYDEHVVPTGMHTQYISHDMRLSQGLKSYVTPTEYERRILDESQAYKDKDCGIVWQGVNQGLGTCLVNYNRRSVCKSEIVVSPRSRRRGK